MNGARQLAASGRPKSRAAIIGEPTSLVPVRMHKGIMMEAVRVTGRAGHSSNPELGNSALEGMHAVMGGLMAYREELGERYRNDFFKIAVQQTYATSIQQVNGRDELHVNSRKFASSRAPLRAERSG